MNQNSNRRTFLWFLLLMTLIFAINYANLKFVTFDEFLAFVFFTGEKIGEALRFFLRDEVTAIATFVTLLGAPSGIIYIWQLVRKNRQSIEKIEKQEKKSETFAPRSTKLDWGNFAINHQTMMSVTASHISIEDRNTIKVGNVPILRRWERPTDRDPFNRQGQAVGRRKELSELWKRLNHDTQAVVAVVGMPGLGKSTVASMFIHEYGSKYAGGQLWTEIGYEFRRQAQCQTILNYWASWAYGGDSQHLQQDEQWHNLQFEPAAVKELLSEQGPLLVVLDDVWDLEAIQPLREALPPETFLLVTTRDERIAKALAGEMPLNVLSPEDALALLQKFLPLMADEQLKPLAHGLGYHAQALTIAGGDIRERSKHRQKKAIKQLLQRVEKGQGFGDLPQLDQQDRQNVVEIAFQFSYDDIKSKMGVDYQQRLRLLGAFGPLEADFSEADFSLETDFSTEAAAALWKDDSDQANEFLDVLHARSLLIKRDEEERWGQHPLLRAYSRALLLLRAQEWEMAKQRYIAYVIDFADKSFERPMQEWASLKPDFPHLYYVGDELFQQLSDRFGDLEALAQPEPIALPSIDELTKERLTMASQFSYNTAGYISNRPEIGERGFNWLWMGLASARLIEEQQETIVGFLLVFGRWYGDRGKPTVALAYLEQALVISRQNELKEDEAKLLNQIGLIYWATSQYEQALKFYNESLAIQKEIGNRNGEASVLANIGLVYQALSQHEKALEFFNQALPILQEVGNRDGEATVLQNIGASYQLLSQSEKALDFFNQALPILQEAGNRNMEANVLQNIGVSYQALSQNEKALEFFNQALPIVQEVGNRYGEANVLQNIGVSYQALSQHEKAF
jgi:tetratricopeptide (TPR) repeat protein